MVTEPAGSAITMGRRRPGSREPTRRSGRVRERYDAVLDLQPAAQRDDVLTLGVGAQLHPNELQRWGEGLQLLGDDLGTAVGEVQAAVGPGAQDNDRSRARWAAGQALHRSGAKHGPAGGQLDDLERPALVLRAGRALVDRSSVLNRETVQSSDELAVGGREEDLGHQIAHRQSRGATATDTGILCLTLAIERDADHPLEGSTLGAVSA